MCGIVGIVGEPPGLLLPMIRQLAHRGPNDAALHEEPGVALGMTRLAIIDIKGGHQPSRRVTPDRWYA